MDGDGGPVVSVVLNTYQRSGLVTRAIRSVLAQTVSDLELIVVDDGSTDGTADAVAAISDGRLTFVRQDHGGLAKGRNRGAALANGPWIVFLDDDDDVEPQWLESFCAVFADDVGLVFAGHKKVNTKDGSVTAFPPESMGKVFGEVTGGCLAGSWTIRRSVFEATGGFLTGLATLVQSEFLLRAIPACQELGLRTETVDAAHFRYHVAPWNERPTLTPGLTIRAATTILERHADAFDRDDESRASWNNVIGVAAARSRDWGLARRHFLRAASARPSDLKNWGRVAAACCPGRGRLWAAQPRRASR